MQAFEVKEKSEVVYNPVGLWIVLAKAEREGRLVVPVVIQHPSHKPFKPSNPSEPVPSESVSDAKPIPSEKDKRADKKALEDHIGKLNWLKDNAKLSGEPLTEFAKTMQMSAYLDNKPLLLRWLTFHAKQAGKTIKEFADIIGINGCFA